MTCHDALDLSGVKREDFLFRQYTLKNRSIDKIPFVLDFVHFSFTFTYRSTTQYEVDALHDNPFNI